MSNVMLINNTSIKLNLTTFLIGQQVKHLMDAVDIDSGVDIAEV